MQGKDKPMHKNWPPIIAENYKAREGAAGGGRATQEHLKEKGV